MAMTIKQAGSSRVDIYENGAYRRCINVSDICGSACDGVYVGVLRPDRVEIYRTSNGSYVRTIHQKSTSIQVCNGLLILQVNGRIEEYNIDNGNLERIYG